MVSSTFPGPPRILGPLHSQSGKTCNCTRWFLSCNCTIWQWATSKKLVPKSGKIGKKWKYSEMFVFALSMKSNVSGTQRKKNRSLISSQEKVMVFLVNSLYICIGTGFWGKFYIYTRKILFVSHQRASWPNHMTQFLSRSVVTHHTTHIAICIWHDHDF